MELAGVVRYTHYALMVLRLQPHSDVGWLKPKPTKLAARPQPGN